MHTTLASRTGEVDHALLRVSDAASTPSLPEWWRLYPNRGEVKESRRMRSPSAPVGLIRGITSPDL